MAKLPFMKFFPSDWLAEERLRMVPLAARGLWMYMLCLMHKGDRRGFLTQANGSPLTSLELAQVAGCTQEEAAHLTQKLIDSGVASVSSQGVIFSRRMVHEERLREARSAAGKKGGNPNLFKQTVKLEDKHTLEYGNIVSGFSEGGCKGETEPPGELSPEWLARQWRFYLRRPPNRADEIEGVAACFAEMIRHGVTAEKIRDEILSKERRRVESLWDLESRLLPKGNNAARTNNSRPISRSVGRQDSIAAGRAKVQRPGSRGDSVETGTNGQASTG